MLICLFALEISCRYTDTTIQEHGALIGSPGHWIFQYRNTEDSSWERYPTPLMEVKNRMELHGIVTLPVIPLRGIAVLPNEVMHCDIGRKKTLSAMEQALSEEGYAFFVSQKNAKVVRRHTGGSLLGRYHLPDSAGVPHPERHGASAGNGCCARENFARDLRKPALYRAA